MENRNKGRLGELVQLFENRRKNDMESGECFIKLSFPFVDEILLPILKAALPEPTRVLSLDEILTGVGVGWLENWYAADPDEEGDEERFCMTECAWVYGCLVTEDGNTSRPEQVKALYNQHYGMRVWTGPLPEEERRETPWEPEERSR